MEAVLTILMYCVAFGAIIVLFGSLIGIAFWLLREAWRIATRPPGLR
jgi:uncharacterized membrane protein